MKNRFLVSILITIFICFLPVTGISSAFINAPEDNPETGWQTSFPYQRDIYSDFRAYPYNESAYVDYKGELDEDLKKSDYVSNNGDIVWDEDAEAVGIENTDGSDTLSGTNVVHLGNLNEPNQIKHIYVECKYRTSFDPAIAFRAYLNLPDGYTADVNYSGVSVTPLGGDAYLVSGWFKVAPNPPWEEIVWSPQVPPGEYVWMDDWHLATECVSIPVTINGYTFDENSSTLTNKWLPASVGTTWTVEAQSEGQSESVTYSFEEVDQVYGVNCLRVKYYMEIESANYEWFAQDTDGNVHRFKAMNEDGDFFEVNSNSQIPNFLMLAYPKIGDRWDTQTYRTDTHIIVSDSAQFGSHTNCLKIRVEKGNGTIEYQYYALEIGLFGVQSDDGGDNDNGNDNNDGGCGDGDGGSGSGSGSDDDDDGLGLGCFISTAYFRSLRADEVVGLK